MVVRIVLQARMGSKRRPGKTLADIGGRPLLARCLERLWAAVERGGPTWQLHVATSVCAGDDPIMTIATAMGFRCIRGPEDDVLARYLQAASDLADDDVIVRATADNPLYCSKRTVRFVQDFLASGDDYWGLDPLSPLVPEAMRASALRAAAARNDLDAYCREHVTPYFRRSPSPFRVRLFPPSWSNIDPSVRLTVDTPEDIAAIDRLYRTLIALTGEDRAAAWTVEQITATARGLAATEAAEAEFPASADSP